MYFKLKIFLLFIALLQVTDISAQLNKSRVENQNLSNKLDAQLDFSVSAYIQKENIQKVTKGSFKYITEIIYFGIDVDEMGNIDIQNAKKDFKLLDSLSDENPVNKSVCFGGWGRSDFL